jgi:signal transduction histidine kinase/CheY-like chemotaxis protein
VDSGTDKAITPIIQAEQVRAVYRHLSSVMRSTFPVITILWLMVYDSPNIVPLACWTVLFLLLIFTRLHLARIFHKRIQQTADILRWGHYHTICALLSGLFWGSLATITTEESPAEFFAIIGMLGIVAAAAVGTSSPYRISYIVYVTPLLLLTSTTLLLHGEAILALIGYSLLLVLIAYSKTVEQSFLESLRIRFEKEALAEQLKHQKQEADRANMAKSKFLAAASHDLRQPLHALGLYLDTMNTELDKGSSIVRQKQLAQKMGVAVTALNDLFQSLLDISRLDAGIVEPNVAHHAVSGLFERMKVRFSPFAKLKDLKLTFQHDKEVVMSDMLLLERILDNLISNAIRYTDAGTVSVKAADSGDDITIEVKDTGPGIPQNEQENIFTEFYQLHNPERDRTKGLGLGLSISKRLCLLLNCNLELQSQPGRGSQFRLRVPKGDIKKVSYAPANLPRFDWDLDGVYIMVIDDETDVRDAMHELLTSWGCNAICVDSTKEAINAIEQGHFPELVIADYRLRESRTGVEAIRDISELLQTRIPGILITGDTAPERLQEAMQSGYKLLHKPVNASQLRTVVNRLLMQHRKG